MDQNLQTNPISGGLLELIDELWVLIRETKSEDEAVPLGPDNQPLENPHLLDLGGGAVGGAAAGSGNPPPPPQGPSDSDSGSSNAPANPEMSGDDNEMPMRSAPDGAEEPLPAPGAATVNEDTADAEDPSMDATNIKKSGT